MAHPNVKCSWSRPDLALVGQFSPPPGFQDHLALPTQSLDIGGSSESPTHKKFKIKDVLGQIAVSHLVSEFLATCSAGVGKHPSVNPAVNLR